MFPTLNLRITLEWPVVNSISSIDRFDAKWSSIEKIEGQSLRYLKNIETVKSVGASTRIEGSQMSDQEVDLLIQNIQIDKLTERDQQEVAGYYEVLNLIFDSHSEIVISENSLKDLHQRLLKYSSKDDWHRGNYKQHSNSVEATFQDGTKQVIFQTTPPGYETNDAMRNLIDWYHDDKDTHALVKCASFCYEFVSIHPFQDGNGRSSRLISTLLLLKHNYTWIEFISFEHEIEHRKNKYYAELRKCQAQRPNENITSWVLFYLDCLFQLTTKLSNKLKIHGIHQGLAPREKAMLVYIDSHPGCQSRHLAEALQIPNPTAKRILGRLLDAGLILKHGIGRGTNYTVV